MEISSLLTVKIEVIPLVSDASDTFILLSAKLTQAISFDLSRAKSDHRDHLLTGRTRLLVLFAWNKESAKSLVA